MMIFSLIFSYYLIVRVILSVSFDRKNENVDVIRRIFETPSFFKVLGDL